MNSRWERPPWLLVPYGIGWTSGVLVALIVLMSACAPLTVPRVPTPTATTPSGWEPNAMTESSAVPIPHGLADRKGEFAYVTGPQGLIYRLDLSSGATQARTQVPGSPLVIYDDALIGWSQAADSSNAVRIFSVSPQQDVLSMSWERDLELPAWVEVGSPEPERFTLGAELRDEELVVTWAAHARYSGGAPPTPEIEASETRDAGAVVYLDPQSGKILREAQVTPVPSTQPPLPTLPPNWRFVPYLKDESWYTQPWPIDAEEAFLVTKTDEPGIFLLRRPSGSQASPVEIRLTEDPGGQATVTPDGQLVFIHAPGMDAPSWRVYSVKTGEEIARLPFDPGTQGASVVDGQVLYLVVQETGPTRRVYLRSRDMPTGRELWSFTLQEEATRTPPPPPPGP